MNEQLRSFMIKQSPKLMKTVIDKANHGGLPDTLTVGEISSLWSRDGLANETQEWKEATVFLLDLIMRKKLVCENMDVALGNPDPQKVQYERIASGLGYDSSVSGNTNYSPINALVKKDSLLHFLCESGGKSIVDGLLINKWLQDSQENGIEINPRHAGSPTYLKRDSLALEFVNKNPESRKETPAAIKAGLQEFDNKEFFSGYDDWWNSQIIFPRTSKGGRPKKK